MTNCQTYFAVGTISGANASVRYDLLTIVKGCTLTEEHKGVATTVRELRKGRGWSLANLGGRAGVDPTTIWKIEHGKTPNPGQETLGKISDALGVRVSVLTGERPAPMRKMEIREGVATLPLRTLRVQADGRPAWADTSDSVAVSVKAASGRKNAFAATVTGICMQPHIHPGDIVLIDPDRQPRDGDMVVVTDDQGATMVKWYRVDPLGRPFLRAADGTQIRPNGAKLEGIVFRVERDPMRDPEA